MRYQHPYAYRLTQIQAHYIAAVQSIEYVARFWSRLQAEKVFDNVSIEDLKNATANIEATYVVRLFAEFEGILKDHLTTNHKALSFDEKRHKVGDLLIMIVRAERIVIGPSLRLRFDNIRSYRNSIAHQSHAAVQSVEFTTALEALSIIVSKFAQPYNK